jgi:hypothetical protein
MDAATITAISAGVVGVIGAVTALVATLRHVTNPAAHQVPGKTGPGESG